MNPIEAGLVDKWRAVYGDLNLWDFYVMNEYLTYKNQVNEKVHDWYERKTAMKNTKIELLIL